MKHDDVEETAIFVLPHGDGIPQKVLKTLPDYTALHPKRQ
jgi:hypothetical protein